MPSRRIARINGLIREEIAELLRREVKDAALTDALISITEVETSPDLRNARVFFSVYGDDEQVRQAQLHLERAGGFLHRQLMGRVELRQVPRLEFVLDESIARGDRIMQLMRGIDTSSPDGQPA
ncbi:MAG: 30S ribosome-binding factor RbfA [Chloroflexi bacterium]|nr:30S ribosome-binding factor RbfA [Chloroflexota bacterium]